MTYYFAIIGTKDNPIYETDFSLTSAKSTGIDPSSRKDENRHLNQFIVHSALDLVEELQWHSNT
ncbi:11327_t:CDS:2, partial [Scutellospora calospora]